MTYVKTTEQGTKGLERSPETSSIHAISKAITACSSDVTNL